MVQRKIKEKVGIKASATLTKKFHSTGHAIVRMRLFDWHGPLQSCDSIAMTFIVSHARERRRVLTEEDLASSNYFTRGDKSVWKPGYEHMLKSKSTRDNFT